MRGRRGWGRSAMRRGKGDEYGADAYPADPPREEDRLPSGPVRARDEGRRGYPRGKPEGIAEDAVVSDRLLFVASPLRKQPSLPALLRQVRKKSIQLAPASLLFIVLLSSVLWLLTSSPVASKPTLSSRRQRGTRRNNSSSWRCPSLRRTREPNARTW